MSEASSRGLPPPGDLPGVPERLAALVQTLFPDASPAQRVQRCLQLLTDVLNHSPVVVWASDREGRMCFSEGQSLQRLNLLPGEVVGRSLYELYRDAPAVLDNLQTVLSGGSVRAIVPVGEQYWDSWQTPLRDDAGEVIGAIGVAIEVTDLVRTDRQLRELNATLEQRVEARTTDLLNAHAAVREAEQRWRALVENAPDVILLVDAAGTITFINHTRLRPELTREQCLGCNMREFVYDEYAHLIGDALQRVFESGERVTIVCAGPRGDGSQIWYSANLGPVWGDGAVEGAIVICCDVTSERIAKEEAALLQTQLAHVARISTAGELSASLAHELNQPLAAIVDYAEGSLIRLDSPQTDINSLRGALQEIRLQAQRAVDIIRRLRVFLTRQSHERQRVDLNSIAQDAVRMAEIDARRRGVELVTRLHHEPLLIAGDPAPLVQVILNLMVNAMESLSAARTPRGRITISSGDAPEGYWLEVTDNGPGVCRLEQGSIFDAWVTTKPEGLGLGLSISRTIVATHEGLLDLVPRRPGQGATFRITLPKLQTKGVPK